jgi:hypothetical protein
VRDKIFTFIRHSKQVFKYRVLEPVLANAERAFLAPQFEHFLGPESAIVERYSTLIDEVIAASSTGLCCFAKRE